jgi:hypothetical protein
VIGHRVRECSSGWGEDCGIVEEVTEEGSFGGSIGLDAGEIFGR